MNNLLNQINSLQDVTKYTKQFQKFGELKVFSNDNIEELLGILNTDSFIINSLDYEVLDNLCLNFMNAFEERCSKIIEEQTGQKKIEIGTKVKVKYDFKGKEILNSGDIATITNVIRFDEDTFGQGWYIYELNDYFRVYDREFDVIS